MERLTIIKLLIILAFLIGYAIFGVICCKNAYELTDEDEIKHFEK